MLFTFAKYHGAGNDFIIVDDTKLKFPVKDQNYISHLCNRRFGIGADGLILLQPSKQADFRMRIFNSDGKETAQCGNGLRCLADFIRQNFSQHLISIETNETVVPCSFAGDLVHIDLGPYRWKKQGTDYDLIHTGVPHVVSFVADLDVPHFKSTAAKIRHEEDANVNYALIKEDKIFVRTYERGVEDETLSCGTGAAAVAVAAIKKFQLKNRICIVPASKEELYVEVKSERVQLSGPATFVFLGTIG